MLKKQMSVGLIRYILNNIYYRNLGSVGVSLISSYSRFLIIESFIVTPGWP